MGCAPLSAHASAGPAGGFRGAGTLNSRPSYRIRPGSDGLSGPYSPGTRPTG